MADLITVSEAASIARVSPETIRDWANRGLIPSQRTLGGHRRIDADGLRDALERAQRPHDPEQAS